MIEFFCCCIRHTGFLWGVIFFLVLLFGFGGMMTKREVADIELQFAAATVIQRRVRGMQGMQQLIKNVHQRCVEETYKRVCANCPTCNNASACGACALCQKYGPELCLFKVWLDQVVQSKKYFCQSIILSLLAFTYSYAREFIQMDLTCPKK